VGETFWEYLTKETARDEKHESHGDNGLKNRGLPIGSREHAKLSKLYLYPKQKTDPSQDQTERWGEDPLEKLIWRRNLLIYRGSVAPLLRVLNGEELEIMEQRSSGLHRRWRKT